MIELHLPPPDRGPRCILLEVGPCEHLLYQAALERVTSPVPIHCQIPKSRVAMIHCVISCSTLRRSVANRPAGGFGDFLAPARTCAALPWGGAGFSAPFPAAPDRARGGTVATRSPRATRPASSPACCPCRCAARRQRE